MVYGKKGRRGGVILIGLSPRFPSLCRMLLPVPKKYNCYLDACFTNHALTSYALTHRPFDVIVIHGEESNTFALSC